MSNTTHLANFAQTVAAFAANGQCRCGCELPVTRKVRFRPGHDARLVSVLVAQSVGHLTSTEVNNLIADVSEFSPALGTKFALAYDRAERKMVAKATRLREKADKAEAKANAGKVTDEAAAFTVGEVKIGRWTYPAQFHADKTLRNTKRDGSGEWVAV